VKPRILAVFVCTALGCVAQPWNIGGAVGYGAYRNGSLKSGAGSATAGIENHFALSAWIGEDLYDRWGGELRYSFQNGGPFVESGGVRTAMAGKTHAIHFDILRYFAPKDAKIRPYASCGLGAKSFVVTGSQPMIQPLRAIGLLTAVNQVKPVISLGGGAKIEIAPHLRVRVDMRDYISPMPANIFTPVLGGKASGLFHQFTPTVGIDFTI